ncbi:DUF2867 domain-containing protein [Heliophilum fasciatum]|uniref:Uncharacterized protein DUF2867 n=1 Tax=Heliophilum fasciatum TaxID=35700 RepID=A0A4R2R9H8_9FIRM|nr:DUF2867 domain-containing protein [Heliophilum fasciatum]MCW2279519.1 hypothetical protein [Heliophilum fasciatum]TCP58619.1 uncharacterized protein DUF2867 [Heliophilum fasciatum]
MNQSNQLKVQEIPIPPHLLIARSLPRIDYGDAYRVPWPRDLDQNIIAFVYLLFTSAPSWVTTLTVWRNRIVKLFGIKVPETVSAQTPDDFSFEPGTKASFFRVYEHTPEELLIGDDDRHLNFRLSFSIDRQESVTYAVVATAVQIHNGLGQAYFLPVRPFHRLMVPAMIRSALKVHAKKNKSRTT